MPPRRLQCRRPRVGVPRSDRGCSLGLARRCSTGVTAVTALAAVVAAVVQHQGVVALLETPLARPDLAAAGAMAGKVGLV